jgi:YbbR domain-containing protein
MDLEVRTSHLAGQFIVTSELPMVTVSFSGKGRELLRLKVRRPWIALNLDQARVGKNTLPIRPEDVMRSGSNASIVKTSPSQLELFVSERGEKTLAPTVVTQGVPKSGYAIREVQCGTAVRVTGPKDRMRHLFELYTQPVDVSNQSASFGRQVALASPSTNDITASPCSVFVQVVIEPEMERVFSNVPVHIIYPPGAAAKIVPAAIESLMITGPESLVEQSTLDDFSITIDLRGKIRGRYSLPAEIRLPKYLRLVGSKPKVFAVILR